MSQYKYKNLLFYSNRDPASLSLLQQLTKNPLLDQQFIKICINDPRVKIPDRIIQYNKIPVIVCPGFDKPILGEDAFTWIMNNNFSEKSNGNLDFGKIESGATDIHSQLVEEFKGSDYNQFHNSEYNLGFSNPQTAGQANFTNLAGLGTQIDPSRITTFEDNESKRGAKAVLDQRMEQLKFQRDNEYGAPKRTGGLEHNQSYQNNQYRQAGSDSGNVGQGNSGNAGNSGQDPMGAQLTAFGNFGSNLDSAYEPITDKNPVGGNRNGVAGNQSQTPSTPGLQYNPNPNVSPRMMMQQMPQVPQIPQFMNHTSGQRMPQMPQMPQMPVNNRGQPFQSQPFQSQSFQGQQMPQMPRGMPQMPSQMPQIPMTNRGMPNRNMHNQIGGGGMNSDMNPHSAGMPPFPGNRPHPNMLLEHSQNRGNSNPYVNNQPNPPRNGLTPATMDRPPASLMAKGEGPMMPMTPSHQGLPEPSGGSQSNFYQL